MYKDEYDTKNAQYDDCCMYTIKKLFIYTNHTITLTRKSDQHRQVSESERAGTGSVILYCMVGRFSVSGCTRICLNAAKIKQQRF